MDVSLSPRARTTVIWIAAIAGGFILLESAHALSPFAWAIITAYIFHPVVSFVHRKTRLPKHLITAWLYIMLGLIITILVINYSPLVVEQAKGVQDEIPNAFDEVQVWLDQNQSDSMQRLGLEPNFVDQRLNEFAENLASSLSDAAVPLVFSTFSIAIEFFVYLVASFYFIVYGDKFVNSIRTALNRRFHNEFDRLMLEINATLGRYIRGQALLVVIMSTASFIALSILEIHYALLIAILTGFLELIPLIGPWVAGSIAVSVALFQTGTPFGWTHLTLAIVVAVIYFLLRQFEDAFIIPMVIGRFVHLHPLLVIFVIVIGTSLGGVLGLILAVPVAAVMKILATYFYRKLVAREARHIEVVSSRNDLGQLVPRLSDLVNATVVLMIEPEVLRWEDLPLVRKVAEAAQDHAVALSAVTPDGIAGSLLTAVGIPTTAFQSSPAPITDSLLR